MKHTFFLLGCILSLNILQASPVDFKCPGNCPCGKPKKEQFCEEKDNNPLACRGCGRKHLLCEEKKELPA